MCGNRAYIEINGRWQVVEDFWETPFDDGDGNPLVQFETRDRPDLGWGQIFIHRRGCPILLVQQRERLVVAGSHPHRVLIQGRLQRHGRSDPE